jgi:hypothetical protein
MLKIDVVRFDIPKDSPSQVAQRIDEALQQVDRSQNTVLRMVFTVTPSPALLRKKTLNEFRNAVEPFRSRVRYTCVENVVVVRNPAARAIARATLLFFQPQVPTRVVDRYFTQN